MHVGMNCMNCVDTIGTVGALRVVLSVQEYLHS